MVVYTRCSTEAEPILGFVQDEVVLARSRLERNKTKQNEQYYSTYNTSNILRWLVHTYLIIILYLIIFYYYMYETHIYHNCVSVKRYLDQNIIILLCWWFHHDVRMQENVSWRRGVRGPSSQKRIFSFAVF